MHLGAGEAGQPEPIGIALLGSTGSIGRQTVDVLTSLGSDRFDVVALAAGRDAATLGAQADRLRPRVVAMADPVAARSLDLPSGSKILDSLTALLVVCIPAFLLGSYFYLRNWVLHGNPAGIFEVRLGSMVLFEGFDLKSLLWRDNLVPPALYNALSAGNEWPIVLDGFFVFFLLVEDVLSLGEPMFLDPYL